MIRLGFVLVCLMFASLPVVAQAQQPTPWYVATLGPVPLTPWYLATAYPGQLSIPTAYPTPMPPPIPTIGPMSTPWGFFTVTCLDPTPVYMCPSQGCYVYTTLPRDTVITVRWAGPGWLQIESGWATGSYIPDTAWLQR